MSATTLARRAERQVTSLEATLGQLREELAANGNGSGPTTTVARSHPRRLVDMNPGDAMSENAHRRLESMSDEQRDHIIGAFPRRWTTLDQVAERAGIARSSRGLVSVVAAHLRSEGRLDVRTVPGSRGGKVEVRRITP